VVGKQEGTKKQTEKSDDSGTLFVREDERGL
jgi:hypothetical protein